ncbi:MAG: YbaK/EbsC family protein [Acidobacteriota bacterium]
MSKPPPVQRAVHFIAWLRGQNVPFQSQKHAEVYTAQEVAAVMKVSGYELAKVVVLNVDGSSVLAVLPAPLRVDFRVARSALGAKKISLASEATVERLFPGCERGAMPPFGNLWGIKTYVDESLATHQRIVFNAGSHIETVSMAYADFERLARSVRTRLAQAGQT